MRLRWLPPALATSAGLLLLLAGPTVRLGFWEFPVGFKMLRWGAYAGLAAAGLAVLFLMTSARRGALLPLLLAVIVGGASAAVPRWWLAQARRVPPIHDITTDTDRPPEFVAVLPLRAQAPNPATYGGPELAAAQREGYPDLAPLLLNVSPAEAFGRALAAGRAMAWHIVAADSAHGRIEATATTLWFGFQDDIVVRITPEGAESRVDVRSVSRVGESDVGTNARRIRAFLARLAA